MCGLAGIVLRDAARIDRATLERRGAAMAATVKHRGPDGWGCWTDGKALLVHTRLAIIDTSNDAAQPMQVALSKPVDPACDLDEVYNVVRFNENSNDLTDKLTARLDQVIDDIGGRRCNVAVTGY